ncbi:HAD family hydrolase [Aquirufa sp. ROCK-SH2]
MSKKSLLFDLGNVLLPIDLDKTYQAFADLSTEFNADQIKILTQEKSLWQKYEAGLQSNNEFRDYLRGELFLECTDSVFDAAFSALLLDFPQNTYTWLQSVSENYPIHLLSNTSEIHANIFTKIPLGPNGESLFHLFSEIFYSFELGLTKPDENIYQLVLNKLELSAQDLIFFDDNAYNIQAAQKLGIHAFQITDPSQSLIQIDQILEKLC